MCRSVILPLLFLVWVRQWANKLYKLIIWATKTRQKKKRFFVFYLHAQFSRFRANAFQSSFRLKLQQQTPWAAHLKAGKANSHRRNSIDYKMNEIHQVVEVFCVCSAASIYSSRYRFCPSTISWLENILPIFFFPYKIGKHATGITLSRYTTCVYWISRAFHSHSVVFEMHTTKKAEQKNRKRNENENRWRFEVALH